MEAANEIARVLREKSGLEVDVVNLRKQSKPDVAPYANIVIGGGVRMGKLYKEALTFLENDLAGKRVAFFLCAGAGGNPRHRDELIKRYITNSLANYPTVKPIAVEAFGGCIRIFGKTVTDTRDLAKVQSWAEELGKKLSE